MVGAGGGVGLALGASAGAASPSCAGGAGTLRTLLTRSVSRDTECRPGGLDGWKVVVVVVEDQIERTD